MAQIHKELRRREPTSLHTDLAKYIKTTTGYDADLETIKLALMLGPIYRTSDENMARRERDQAARDKAEQARLDEIEARKQAIIDKKAAAKAEKVRRARERLAVLEADDEDAPRVRRPVTKAAAPVRSAGRAAKAPVKKAPAKVVPIKRAAPKPAAEPTPERGALRESSTEDDGWGDTVEEY